MSEEQTGFKVTDRRLFNADGTPREVEREEATDEAARAEAATVTDERRDDSSADIASPASASETRERAAAAAEPSSAGGAKTARAPAPEDEADEESRLPGADDPASFINFLMSIASNAAAALGMMEHPVTGERGVDLPLAKHWIDVLGMLHQKTQGNLHNQEQQIFEGLLSDLRMQYVSLTSTAPPTPRRGFTGRDITGGK
jgi:hypothetical protein